MSNVILKKLPEVIILLVSVLAFGASFIYDQYISGADDYRTSANNHLINANKIEETMTKVDNRDFPLFDMYDEKYSEGLSKAIQYNLLYAGLSLDERNAWAYDSAMDFAQASAIVARTYIFTVDQNIRVATVEQNILIYVTQTSFMVNISKSTYLAAPSITTTTSNIFFPTRLSGLDLNVIDSIIWSYNIIKSGNGATNSPVHDINSQYFFTFRTPIIEAFDNETYNFIISKSYMEAYINAANSIGTGITLTTVANILASAMQSRSEDKSREHELSEIRHDISKDATITPETDKFVLPISLIALIISLLGFLMIIF